MDNIYQELNLHPDMPFEQIRQELSDKEQTWRRREGKRPELARKKLYAIEQAKTIFSSPASKAEYDKQ